MKINWLKFRALYFTLSVLMIAIGLYSLTTWGFNLDIEFTGGSVIEYKFESSVSTEDLKAALSDSDIDVSSVVTIGEQNYLLKLGQVNVEQREKIKEIVASQTEGSAEEERFENVGPTIGPELVKKTLYAIAVSASVILLWVAYQFKSIKFGVCAILAMFHDTFILVSSFAFLGHFYGAEVDFLFVTAVLTTLSFSVHDTIVVYDRIREIKRKHGGETIDIANRALSETMRRSINNSVTIALMLVALVVLGGSTIKWFALALLIGTILGTYSSPFVAVPLLITWEQVSERLKRRPD